MVSVGKSFFCIVKGETFRMLTKGVRSYVELKKILMKFEKMFHFLKYLTISELIIIFLRMVKRTNS